MILEQPKEELIRVYPKPNCRYCYGRGYIGEREGKRVECRCLMRTKAHVPPKDKK